MLESTQRRTEILALVILVLAVASVYLLSEANLVQIVSASIPQANTGGESPSPAPQKINISVFVFGDGNKPIQNATVTIIGGSKPYSTKTDKTGLRLVKDFGFNTNNSYRIKVEAKGYRSDEKPLLPSSISSSSVSEHFYLARVASVSDTNVNADSTVNSNSNPNANGNGNATRNENNAGGSRNETEPSLWSFLVDHWFIILVFLCVIAVGLYGLMRGYRVAVYNLETSYGPIPKRFQDILSKMGESVRALESQQQSLAVKIDSVLRAVSTLTNTVRTEEDNPSQKTLGPESREELSEQYSRGSLSPSETPTYGTAPRRSLEEWARGLFRMLIANVGVSPEPIYLNADATSTPTDMIEERKIFLQEVNNNQGAFVVFSDDGGQGLVFPNPILAFRPLAIRSVFPVLTEDKFNNAKEGINPVRVSRVSDGRWKVEG